MAKFLAAIFVLVSLSSVSSASIFKESRDTKLADPPREITSKDVILILSDSDRQRIFPKPGEKDRTSETTPAPDKSCFTVFGRTHCRLKEKKGNWCVTVTMRPKHHERKVHREEEYRGETKNESHPLRRGHGVRRHPHRRRHRDRHEIKSKSRNYDRHRP